MQSNEALIELFIQAGSRIASTKGLDISNLNEYNGSEAKITHLYSHTSLPVDYLGARLICFAYSWIVKSFSLDSYALICISCPRTHLQARKGAVVSRLLQPDDLSCSDSF